MERARDALAITAPDELLITQAPLAIIIEHPSKPGTHPEAGVFNYGTGGAVGGFARDGDRIGGETGWNVFHIGTQLIISRSSTAATPGVQNIRSTIERASTWRLADGHHLVIEFSESRTGERPTTATRVFARLPA